MTTALLPRYTAIFGADGFLNKYNIERRDEIELLGLSSISAVDMLLLGEPGVGKTWAIELLVNECLTDMELFSILMMKEMSADEVLGPRDIMALKQSIATRMMDGYLPTANYAYLDEVFKSSPTILNPLLDILANRVIKVGGKVSDVSQLVSIFFSSNELPDREDLSAFRDRIGVSKVVSTVRTPEGRRAVTDIQLDFQSRGLDTTGLDPLSLADIQAIRGEVRQVKVSDAIRDIMVDAQAKWQDAGHLPSPRRVGQMWKMVKARAWTNGRTEVMADDLIVCQHMAWNHPDNINSAREVIIEYASQFTRKAQNMRESMEPVVRSLEELRTKVEAATSDSERDDLLRDGFGLMRQLKRMAREGEDLLRDGRDQSQDTTLLEGVLNDINRSYNWAKQAMEED